MRNPDNVRQEKVYLDNICVAAYFYDAYDPEKKKLVKRIKQARQLCETHLKPGDSIHHSKRFNATRLHSSEVNSSLCFYSVSGQTYLADTSDNQVVKENF